MYGDKGDVPDGENVVSNGVAVIERAGTDVTDSSFGKNKKNT